MAVILNRSHPLVQGLVFCVAGANTNELVSGAPATFGGAKQATLNGRTRWGDAFETTVTNGTEWIAWSDAHLATKITTQHTVVAVVDIDTRTSFAPFLSIPYANGSWGSPFVSIFFGASSSNGFLEWQWTVGGSRSNTSVAGLIAGSHVYGWTRKDNAHVVTIDGADVYNTTSGSSGSIDFGGSATTAVIQGRSSTSTGESHDGRTYMVGLWNRVLLAGEIDQLAKNPSQIFVPNRSDPSFLSFAMPTGAPSSSGVASSTATTVSTPTGSRQTSGAVSARVAVTATATESRQTSGAVSARVAVTARAAGSQATAIAGVARPTVAVTATATESRQTSGVISARVAVVIRTAGSQVTTAGGAVRATVVGTARAVGNRQTSGVVSARVAVVTQQSASRATSGTARAVGAVVAKPVGASTAVIQGVITATFTVTARCAASRATTGATSAGITVTCRTSAKRATSGIARAAVVTYCLTSARRATSGTSRAVGVVYATPYATSAALGGDAQMALTAPGATHTFTGHGATVTFQRVNRATHTMEPQ